MSLTLDTSAGPLKILLYWQECPQASLNFLAQAAQGNFSKRTATAIKHGVHFKVPRDSVSTVPHLETEPEIKHVAGAVGLDKFHRSSFYVLTEAAPELDGKHTVVGRIAPGSSQETLKKLLGSQINDVQIHANPFAAIKPKQGPNR